MRAIYKYPVKIKPHQVVNMPLGSKILSVGKQQGGIVIWAEVELGEEEQESVFFFMYTTGEQYLYRGDRNVFLGTIQLPLENEYVVHVFYEKLAI